MLALLLAVCGPAAALNPDIRLADYNHVSWTTKDGAPAEVKALAQTTNGWLWLGTNTGLFRFDGLRFERYELPSADDFAKRRITELRAHTNGDLWISYSVGGLSVLHSNGKLEDVLPLTAVEGTIMTLAIDSDNSIWIASVGGLYHYTQGKLDRIGPERGVAAGVTARSVLLDQYGQLWALTVQGLYRLERTAGKFEQVLVQRNEGSLVQSPDGRLWLAERESVQLLPQATPPAHRQPLPRAAFFNPAESRWGGQFDRDGNLWTPHCPEGLCIVARAGASKATMVSPARDATDRASAEWKALSRVENVVMEDMEGNIWIASQTGLERVRENRLIPVRLPQSSGLYSMAGDTEGGVWTANPLNATAWRLSPNAPPALDNSQPFTIVANDRDGALLLAGSHEIERRYHGQVSKIPLPPGRDGQLSGLNVLGLQDDGKVLWMAASQTGLMGLVDGKWLPRSAFTLPQRIFMGAPGRKKGEQWQATGDGNIVFNDNGKLTTYDGKAIGLVTSITAGEDIIVGGDQGLAIFQGQRFRRFNAAQPEVLSNISGMAVTADGDRWLNGSKGVVHVHAADWRDAVDRPAALLRYELIGLLDGYPGQAMIENRLPSVYADHAGQLWFMASGGIVRLAPGQIRRNVVAPAPEIQVLETDTGTYRDGANLLLPSGSQNFSIRFTAPGLGKPEAMRFRYQLSGVNQDWQDAGDRRTVYYTNVVPGNYRFRVMAYNEDGVPSAHEAVLEFDIEPAFEQTIWFKALCAVGVALVLYLLYQYRLRVATGRVAERMHVRMAERERIARTLHDTFLQSVQALILRLDLVTVTLPPDSEARGRLESLLEHANGTIVEGRDQVHELRSGRIDDVENAAREAGRLLEHEYPATKFSLMVCGTRVKLDSQVAEEACEIGREAMRNAFRHASAANVEVQLIYEREQFILQVSDDGKGMGAGENKQRHYGLIGMRERAQRAGGRLDIDSKPGSTRVALTVPAALAYVGGGRRWWHRLRGQRQG